MKLSSIAKYVAIPTIAVITASISAHAETFLNFGQMGVQGSFAFETYPTITHSNGKTSVYLNNIIPYFTQTGFTGTKRDQFEFWAGAAAGYSEAASGLRGSSFGVSNPSIGAEYYYNLIQPTVPSTSRDYVIDTISPFGTITFPTGSRDNTGFLANSNNFTYFGTVTNLLTYGRWTTTIAPVSVIYADRSYTPTPITPGVTSHFRGGLSLQVADIVAGYNITPEFGVGVHHVINLNNVANSSFATSRQGFIGPAVSYTGFYASGLYLFGNLDLNYSHSNSLKNAPYLSFVLVKYF